MEREGSDASKTGREERVEESVDTRRKQDAQNVEEDERAAGVPAEDIDEHRAAVEEKEAETPGRTGPRPA